MSEPVSEPPNAADAFTDFDGYLTPTSDDYADVLSNGLIVVDTNVLLSLYRYHLEARSDLISALGAVGDRLWVPHRTLEEFFSKRESVIRDVRDHAKEVTASLGAEQTRTEEIIRHWANRAALSKEAVDAILGPLREVFNATKEAVEVVASTWQSHLNEDTNRDPVLPVLVQLLQNRTGDAFSEEDYEKVVAEGRDRVTKRRPPGYKDKDAAEPGDYLVWEQLLREAENRNCNTLLITGDQKEDWWRIEKGERRGPRPELSQEFRRRTGKRLLMLAPGSFLLHAITHLGVTADDESVAELRRLDLWPRISHTLPIQANARNFLDAVYRDHDYAAAWQYLDPTLKICIVQNWLWPIMDEVRQDGYDPDGVVDALTEDDAPDHALWPYFAEKQMEGLATDVEPHKFGTGVTTTVIEPGIEVVYFYPPELGEFLPSGASYPSWPLMMRKSDRGWLVLNYSSSTVVPEPGWPPRVV